MKRRPEKQVPIERAGTRKKPRETAAKGHEMSRKLGHAALLKALPYFDRLPTSWKFLPPGLPGNQLNMRDSCRQPLGINAWIEICCPKLAGWQASASACEIPCAKPLPQELSLFLAILLCKKLRERFKHAQRKLKQLRCKLTRKKYGFSIFRISFCKCLQRATSFDSAEKEARTSKS